MNKLPNFKQFESEQFESADTDNYKAPEYVVKPAEDDKGFAIVKNAFDNQKSYFQPRIASSNHNLATNDSQTPDNPKQVDAE